MMKNVVSALLVFLVFSSATNAQSGSPMRVNAAQKYGCENGLSPLYSTFFALSGIFSSASLPRSTALV